MNILVFGAGVIGQVYAGRLLAAGHDITVVARGVTAEQLRQHGIRLRRSSVTTTHPVAVVEPADLGADSQGQGDRPQGHGDRPDVLIICVRRDQLADALPQLRAVDAGLVVVMMNIGAAPDNLLDALGPDRTVLAFPGVGGRRAEGGVVDYVEIPQQPTTIAAGAPGSAQAREALSSAGFRIAGEHDMPAWLATHTVFITLIGAGILSRGGYAEALGRDRAQVREVVTAVTEGFRALQADGVTITPGALRLLFLTMPRWFAVAYWRRALRGPVGTIAIAPHVRATASTEFALLAADVLALTGYASPCVHLRRLLEGVLPPRPVTREGPS